MQEPWGRGGTLFSPVLLTAKCPPTSTKPLMCLRTHPSYKGLSFTIPSGANKLSPELSLFFTSLAHAHLTVQSPQNLYKPCRQSNTCYSDSWPGSGFSQAERGESLSCFSESDSVGLLNGRGRGERRLLLRLSGNIFLRPGTPAVDRGPPSALGTAPADPAF